MAFPQILEPLQCKIVFNRYLSISRSNQKISKNEVVLFSNFAFGRTLPTQSTDPQPIQLVPKPCFNRYLSNGRSNKKNSKNKVYLFSNFAFGRTLPTQSTGPQPIQRVPKHCFFTDFFRKCISLQCFSAKCARLACLLSFASLFLVHPSLN